MVWPQAQGSTAGLGQAVAGEDPALVQGSCRVRLQGEVTEQALGPLYTMETPVAPVQEVRAGVAEGRMRKAEGNRAWTGLACSPRE